MRRLSCVDVSICGGMGLGFGGCIVCGAYACRLPGSATASDGGDGCLTAAGVLLAEAVPGVAGPVCGGHAVGVGYCGAAVHEVVEVVGGEGVGVVGVHAPVEAAGALGAFAPEVAGFSGEGALADDADGGVVSGSVSAAFGGVAAATGAVGGGVAHG